VLAAVGLCGECEGEGVQAELGLCVECEETDSETESETDSEDEVVSSVCVYHPVAKAIRLPPVEFKQEIKNLRKVLGEGPWEWGEWAEQGMDKKLERALKFIDRMEYLKTNI